MKNTRGNVLLREMTISKLLREAARAHAKKEAIVSDDFRITYARMDAVVDQLAGKLIKLGIRKGDHIGVIGRTSPEIIELIYAVSRIGGVTCMLNTWAKQAELEKLLIRGGVKTLFAGEDVDTMMIAQIEKTLSEKGTAITVCTMSKLQETISVENGRVLEMEMQVQTQDTAMILFTSGSTGAGKPVMSSHYSRVNCGRMQAKDMGTSEKDIFLCALPIFHCFSLSVNILAACAVGGCVCIPKSHHTADLLDAIEKFHCTVFSAVPAIFHTLLRKGEYRKRDISSLRVGIIGGSMYAPRLFEAIEVQLNMRLLSSLGQTEATGGITVSDLDDPLDVRAGTVGHFMDFVEGRIIHLETGEELPQGETGEICARGYVVMQGYYGLEEETRNVIDPDGWLHTGDMGWIDEHGYLHMVGRIKDIIIRGGENICPSEIENLFDSDCRVAYCKALPVPDDHYGEEVCLFVEPSKTAQLTEGDIRSIAVKNLAPFKVPKYIRILDYLPKTPTGKILIRDLKQFIPEEAQRS